MNHLTIAKSFIENEANAFDRAFAEQYSKLRTKEDRMYNDAIVKQLPSINASHTQYREWRIRKRSANRLLRYIRQKNTSPDILEIGCGNGWLTARMAAVTLGKSTGLDINTEELKQAVRVFGDIPNCKFIEGSIFNGVLGEQKFDLIIFAASIQYFESLTEIINAAFEHLTLLGEIHIIDTRFYQYKEIADAKERSKTYFHSMGFPWMAGHYYHHCINSLDIFQPEILYDPGHWWNKLIYPKNPFHWIALKNGHR